MSISKNETFGMMKTLLDAHTMGVRAASALLRDCGYKVVISSKAVEDGQTSRNECSTSFCI